MRLIDADALIGELHNCRFYDGDDRTMVYAVIENQPTIEPQKWIPVNEMLPEVGVNVLLSSGNGMFTAEGCLKDDGDWCQFRWSTIWSGDYVDAWMPLPEPYEEKEQ